MAICPPKKIDSNATSANYAKERCLGELPPNPVWNPLEPNSYSDFGSSLTTVARNPINRSRQRKKGRITDLDASGGLNQDLTIGNSADLLQGFVFADARERATTDSLVTGRAPIGAVVAADRSVAFANIRAVSAAVVSGGSGYRVGDVLSVVGGAARSATVYVAATNPGTGAATSALIDEGGVYAALPGPAAATTGGTGTGATVTLTGAPLATFVAGDIVLAEGFAAAANNGLKIVESIAPGEVVFEQAAANETAPAGATLRTVGRQFDTGDVSIVMNGLLPRFTDVAGETDFRALGFIPGEWVYVEGFAANYGFARISIIDEDFIEFDKTDFDPVVDSGATATVSLYYGVIIRNEEDPALIRQHSYQIERTLGRDVNGEMSEYLIGAVANEFTLNVAQADLVKADLTFIAIDNEQRTGLEGVKPGARRSLLPEDAFNTSSDFNRIKMASVDPLDPNPQPLFGFATDLTLTINNNASPNKAIGYLGGFDVTAGTFDVGGSITVYFSSIEAVKAVRNNADITLDFVMVQGSKGFLFDIPLLSLGNGRLNVEQDQAITLPLDTSGAESKFGNTLTVQVFHYLPDSAS